MREHDAGVPSWERSYQRRRAVELDTALRGGLGPCELAGVPFDEGFRFRRDVEVLFENRKSCSRVSVKVIDSLREETRGTCPMIEAQSLSLNR